MKACKIVVLDIESFSYPLGLERIPTACFLAFHQIPRREDFRDLVTRCLEIGAEWFSWWGGDASRIEDEVDAILEDGGSEAVTTSHARESIDEVLEFVLRSAFPGSANFRLCIVSDFARSEIDGIREMAKLIASRISEP